jgi:hypothetical protein
MLGNFAKRWGIIGWEGKRAEWGKLSFVFIGKKRHEYVLAVAKGESRKDSGSDPAEEREKVAWSEGERGFRRHAA